MISISALARELDLDPTVIIELARMLSIPVRGRTGSAETNLTVAEADAEAMAAEWQRQLASNSLLGCLASSERERRAHLDEELSQARERIQRHLIGPFVASRRKKLFHRWFCKWATPVKDSPARIDFVNRDQAIEAGYRPCKTCRS
jgi:hypothetical protein